MKKIPLTITSFYLLAVFIAIPTSFAESVVPETATIDGREVLLNENGSWQYRSTDRYANTADGRRVRLKEDGSWQYIGNAPLTSKEQVRTAELELKLDKVVIETYEKKVQKNTRVKTQTVFYVQLNYSAQAKNNISIDKSDISLIEVKDNNGKNYPVLSIKPAGKQIQPNTQTMLEIRAKKSPAIWDDVKTIDIVFKPGFSGIEQAITLTRRTIDFEEENVAGFDVTEE